MEEVARKEEEIVFPLVLHPLRSRRVCLMWAAVVIEIERYRVRFQVYVHLWGLGCTYTRGICRIVVQSTLPISFASPLFHFSSLFFFPPSQLLLFLLLREIHRQILLSSSPSSPLSSGFVIIHSSALVLLVARVSLSGLFFLSSFASSSSPPLSFDICSWVVVSRFFWKFSFSSSFLSSL